MNAIAPLTLAETIVVGLLAEYGWSNPEMAEHLHVSRRTIESHISGALLKTQTKNRVQLVLWFQKNQQNILKLNSVG